MKLGALHMYKVLYRVWQLQSSANGWYQTGKCYHRTSQEVLTFRLVKQLRINFIKFCKLSEKVSLKTSDLLMTMNYCFFLVIMTHDFEFLQLVYFLSPPSASKDLLVNTVYYQKFIKGKKKWSLFPRCLQANET